MEQRVVLLMTVLAGVLGIAFVDAMVWSQTIIAQPFPVDNVSLLLGGKSANVEHS